MQVLSEDLKTLNNIESKVNRYIQSRSSTQTPAPQDIQEPPRQSIVSGKQLLKDVIMAFDGLPNSSICNSCLSNRKAVDPFHLNYLRICAGMPLQESNASPNPSYATHLGSDQTSPDFIADEKRQFANSFVALCEEAKSSIRGCLALDCLSPDSGIEIPDPESNLAAILAVINSNDRLSTLQEISDCSVELTPDTDNKLEEAIRQLSTPELAGILRQKYSRAYLSILVAGLPRGTP